MALDSKISLLYNVHMSTLNKNITQDRFSRLARSQEQLFSSGDLGRIWKIKDKNLLNTTLKRYYQAGLLSRVFRGIYSLVPITELNPVALGLKIIRNYAYLGAETVLAQNGFIQQRINYISLIGLKSRRFRAGGHDYYCRQLKDIFLFNDTGIINDHGLKISSSERAIADLLYFNPNFYFDNQARINWSQVKKIQKALGYK